MPCSGEAVEAVGGDAHGDIADDPGPGRQGARVLGQVLEELPGPSLDHVVAADPDDGQADDAHQQSAAGVLQQGGGEVGALGLAAAGLSLGEAEAGPRQHEIEDRFGDPLGLVPPARCLTAGPHSQGVGRLPQPEGEESQDGHPEGDPSQRTCGDRLQRARLVCRLGAGEPGDLQGNPADQQVEHTADGVANAGSDLECRLVLDLVCDTRDIVSTRQRTLPSLSRFYGEVLPRAVRVSTAEMTVSPAQWPTEEVDQRCCSYPLIWTGAPGRREAPPSGASFLARSPRAS